MKSRLQDIRKSICRRENLIAAVSALLIIFVIVGIRFAFFAEEAEQRIKVGFVYVDDESTAYTYNFIQAQNALETTYGEQVETIAKYNVPEGKETTALQELADSGCNLIFTTSYGYGEGTKKFAVDHPEIQFCQATCNDANTEPVLENYHNFMGEIYQGRYLSGVVAGLKLQELIEEDLITPKDAKIGYVGAFPYAEVISGYTAFFLGVRSVVPETVMTVKYTNSWNDYALEKKYAQQLIGEGCVIISQHSDTAGPAVACEQTDASQNVYLVAYNQSMADVAPTTYLTGCKINWEPYILAAAGAVLNGKKIEECVNGTVHGQDVSAGFEEGWVEMLELNGVIAAQGTIQKIDETIEGFKQGNIHVFQGDYIGVNPYDGNDTYDLNQEYPENENSSAPTFGYVLKDVIKIEE
ncbi:MAG: BMP family ABC transporter substrate-binding protein [Eubacterium sp.]|nr:BMP family ABC transporter substrate-binding protein [Eubacterium sp.]